MVVLDMTIANVSVPNIAGGLAVSPSQGTWVITSYAVAEAITVPLTGWLAQRFGAVRVFVIGHGRLRHLSRCCAAWRPRSASWWLFRVLQGLCGRPDDAAVADPAAAHLPAQAAGQAMGLWGMTTVVGPIAGPILGGDLVDNVGWPWVFFINVPVAARLRLRRLALPGQPRDARPSAIRSISSALACWSSGSAPCRSCWTRARTWTGSIRRSSSPWRSSRWSASSPS